MVAVAFATARVGENTLTQKGSSRDGGVGQVQNINQGRLSDSLQKGEVTQEVKELRWRMYKVLKATDGLSAKVIGYDEDGLPIVEVVEAKKIPLKKILVDDYDDYDTIMIVDNSEITSSTFDGSNLEALNGVDGELVKDIDGDDTKTLAEISFNELHSNSKNERPIQIVRDIKPKFEIENYAKKLIVRFINENERLLEFYISKYPDEFDRKTRLLISEIKKAINNPRFSDMLEIKGVNYISNKTMGAKDLHLYEYGDVVFDKIIEFDGHYVIKFISKVTTNGLDIVEKFKDIGLEARYENKEAK